MILSNVSYPVIFFRSIFFHSAQNPADPSSKYTRTARAQGRTLKYVRNLPGSREVREIGKRKRYSVRRGQHTVSKGVPAYVRTNVFFDAIKDLKISRFNYKVYTTYIHQRFCPFRITSFFCTVKSRESR